VRAVTAFRRQTDSGWRRRRRQRQHNFKDLKTFEKKVEMFENMMWTINGRKGRSTVHQYDSARSSEKKSSAWGTKEGEEEEAFRALIRSDTGAHRIGGKERSRDTIFMCHNRRQQRRCLEGFLFLFFTRQRVE
jgi:hypothetical protein